MQQTMNDVSARFAGFFQSGGLQPYARLVYKKLLEGHICVDLQDGGEDLPQGTDHAKVLSKEWQVAKEGAGKQPFILHNSALYLERYFTYETVILQRIQDFIAEEQDCLQERLDALRKQQSLLQTLFPAAAVQQGTDWQKVAAGSAILNNFTIITGGPGTGKTTTVARILSLLYSINPHLKVALAAPTGKAAARMAESLQGSAKAMGGAIKDKIAAIEPSTIHRLLKSNGITFRHNAADPLPYDLLVVDEASMIDAALMAKLMEAIAKGTRLILLGDKDQLASVEAGSLFGDLCKVKGAVNCFTNARLEAFKEFGIPELTKGEANGSSAASVLSNHIVELRVSHRFSPGKGIGKFSKAVIGNDVPIITGYVDGTGDEELVVDGRYSEELLHQFISGYKQYITEKDILLALNKFNNLRVLCAIREGEQGLYSINKKIEQYLQRKKLLRVVGEFYENRPIIINRNYYELGLFNGDIGIMRKDDNGTMKAWFMDGKGGVKAVAPGFLDDVTTVFAMTIHKSQGSEFNEVLVVLPDTASVPLLTRELLYTAVTRARTKAYLQGTREVILSTCSKQVKRGSGIAGRMPVLENNLNN